jgi:hypothetical protein
MISMLRVRSRNEESEAVGQLEELSNYHCFASMHICQCPSPNTSMFSGVPFRLLQILHWAGNFYGADHHTLQLQHMLLQLIDAGVVSGDSCFISPHPICSHNLLTNPGKLIVHGIVPSFPTPPNTHAQTIFCLVITHALRRAMQNFFNLSSLKRDHAHTDLFMPRIYFGSRHILVTSSLLPRY